MTTLLSVYFVIDDTTEIRAQTDEEIPPVLRIGDVSIVIGPPSGPYVTADEVTVADRLEQAVTEWHAEIHRRAAERAEAGW